MSAAGAKPREAGVAIQVLGREYRLGCPPGEEARLLETVDFVNQRITQLREGGKVTGNEKLAVMVALNIAHELLAAKTDRPEKPRAGTGTAAGVDAAEARRRILAMQEALESALGADQEKLF